MLRIIWIVCFLGSTGFCAFMIYGAISDYFEYQVVTVIKTLGENPAAFPTVTICLLLISIFIISRYFVSYSR